MANIRDILGDISFANQVENLDKRSGIDTPEDKYQDFYRPSEVSAPTKALKQLLSGAADAMINFPTAVGETIFNIGATSGAGSPYPVNVPESQYQKFPRVETPAPEGTVENIARMAGGLAGGIGLGQIGAVRNVLYAQPVENAVVRTVDAVFKNKGIGQSLMNEGLKIAAKVGGRAAAAGAANVVGDTAYNLAESTDEQGNIDYDKFADMTADTALFGAVIGGGVNLADKQLFKDVKRVSARLLKAGTEQNRAAVKQADVARTDLQNFEQQKAIVEQQEKVAQQEAAKAVPEELDNIEEAVGPIEEKPDPIDWTEKYKKVREQYDNEVSKAETFDDPVLEPKEATVTEQAKDFTDEVKRRRRDIPPAQGRGVSSCASFRHCSGPRRGARRARGEDICDHPPSASARRRPIRRYAGWRLGQGYGRIRGRADPPLSGYGWRSSRRNSRNNRRRALPPEPPCSPRSASRRTGGARCARRSAPGRPPPAPSRLARRRADRSGRRRRYKGPCDRSTKPPAPRSALSRDRPASGSPGSPPPLSRAGGRPARTRRPEAR